ncbi:MAG: ribose-5-phosphate isomerase [Ruminiclostridium sp.]|nr:ribose-5-phosphate isomerase [Ruminiclostridium sp.]
MKIAVINETSAGGRNKDIIEALEGYGHEIFNLGMRQGGGDPELSYIETGLLAALALNLGKADFVIGGCGTGQGFLNSVMQYPNVFCGLITEPLDAWLFAQINGGNCISLALNKGYGWGGNINLKFIFEKLFSVEWGEGYPPERKVPQQLSRRALKVISKQTHMGFASILEAIDRDTVRKALGFPGIKEFLDIANIQDIALKERILSVL